MTHRPTNSESTRTASTVQRSFGVAQVYWGDFGTRKIHKLSPAGDNSEVLAAQQKDVRPRIRNVGGPPVKEKVVYAMLA